LVHSVISRGGLWAGRAVRDRSRPRGRDGSGRPASSRARLLAQARGVESPDACIPSKSDGSDRRREETERSRVYRRRGVRREPIAAGEKTPDLGLQIRELAVQTLAARIEYDRPLGIQRIQLEPDGFPHAAANAISNDGLAERARRGEADAGPGRWVRLIMALAWVLQLGDFARLGEAKSREQRTGEASTCVVDRSKIG
jgi:hypothetical protein